VLLVAAAFAAFAPSAAAQAPIELVGGTGERTVALTVQPAPRGGTGRVLAGTVLVTARNTSASREVVQVRLSDSVPGTPVLVRQTIPAGAIRQIPVTIQLPSGREPGELDGTLLIESTAPGAHLAVPAASVPVTAVIAPIGDVRFAPNPTVVQVTRWCLVVFACNTTKGGTVELSGAGVPRLLAVLKAAGSPALSTKLRSGSNTLDAELTHLQSDPERPGRATAQLVLGTKPKPGTFTGSIALSSLLAQAPSLEIQVHSRYMFAWAALAILLGVLVAGYLYQQLGLSRRKRVLRELMDNTINGEYCSHRSENSVDGGEDGATLIWDPEIQCPLRDNPAWNYYTELDTPENIYTAIYWARNAADLDEAQTAALTVVRAVKMWLFALSAVRDLWEASQGPSLGREHWLQSAAAHDTALLLRKARHVPADSAACAALVTAAKRQTLWQEALAEAWDLRETLIEGGGNTANAAGNINLLPLIENAKPALSRDDDEQDKLELELEAIRSQLVELAEQTHEQAATPNVEIPIPSEPEREVVSERLRNELIALAVPDRLDFARIQALRAVAPAGASDEHGQAPAAELAGANAGANAAPAQVPSRASRPSPPSSVTSRSGIVRRLALVDLMLSFAILVATAVLYAVTVYGPSWGSAADWASAFGAGFLGQVTVQWALLPMYRSMRLRTGGAAADGATAAVAGAAAA
jgi:hypothetical protein